MASDDEDYSGDGEKSKQQSSEDNKPKGRSPPLLRLTAEMFRQHASMFLQQAAVLERVAMEPTDPTSWKIREEAPENVQKRLLQENVGLLAMKSYESMLQVQKRVDCLERMLKEQGVKIEARTKPSPIEEPILPEKAKDPFYWFRQEQGPEIAEALGTSDINADSVTSKLRRIWNTMNPEHRLPFKRKAQEAEGSKKIAASKKVGNGDTGDRNGSFIDSEDEFLTNAEEQTASTNSEVQLTQKRNRSARKVVKKEPTSASQDSKKPSKEGDEDKESSTSDSDDESGSYQKDSSTDDNDDSDTVNTKKSSKRRRV